MGSFSIDPFLCLALNSIVFVCLKPEVLISVILVSLIFCSSA